MQGVTIVDHPLVQHKLTLIRDKTISTKSFRELLKEIGMLLCYEVTRDLPLAEVEIETPLARMMSAKIAGKKLVFVPVLRAGVTFVEGMLDLVPTARVAHIGLYREPQTFVAVEYFFKSPSDLHERLAIVVSPVLATANTAVAAVDRLKERGARDIRMVTLLAAPEGVERFRGLLLVVRHLTTNEREIFNKLDERPISACPSVPTFRAGLFFAIITANRLAQIYSPCSSATKS